MKPDSKILKEEIFGPVGVIVKFKTEEEVIALANDSVYGLTSHIYTQNLDRAIRVTSELEAGNAFVSSPCSNADVEKLDRLTLSAGEYVQPSVPASSVWGHEAIRVWQTSW